MRSSQQLVACRKSSQDAKFTAIQGDEFAIVNKSELGEMKPSSSAYSATTNSVVGADKSLRERNATSRYGTNLSLLAVLIPATLIFLAALAPGRFGEYHDDGIYVATAKALATNQGYRIISLPYEPPQTKYPPFYPLLLSFIWKINPRFPQNLTWMMLLSVITTLAFVGLTFRYLISQRYAAGWQALLVVALFAINWRTLTLATGIYSEMLYGTLSVASLFIAERNENEVRRWLPIALGLLLGLRSSRVHLE